MDNKDDNFICPPGYITLDYRNTSDDNVGWTHTYKEMIIRAGVFPSIMIFGLISNLLFMFVLIRVKEMRTITNFYLANLAVADFLYLFMQGLTTGLNVLTYGIVQGQFYRSSVGCNISGTFLYMPYFTSIGLITLVSFERFIGVCYPLKSRKWSSKSRTVKLVIFTWILGFLPTLLRIPNKNRFLNFCIMWPNRARYDGFPHFTRVCTWTNRKFVRAWPFVEFIPFTIAMVCNTVFYTMIIKTLSKRSDGIGEKSRDTSMKGNNLRNHVARMLITNGVAFFICMSPYQFAQVCWVIMEFTDLPIPFWTPGFEYAFFRVAAAMTLVNSAINPVVYGASNPRVRKAFRQAFGCDTLIPSQPSPVIQNSSQSTSTRQQPQIHKIEAISDANVM
ncbi:somatostatin receptor type 2-like [Amphiura filiformis]|uniref:somatostatin receptor type 2-like n=1 Tax=Amphiura filiformis TaxID=82378 RepID=UPI003B22117E